MHVKARFRNEAVKKYDSSYYDDVAREVDDLAEDKAFLDALHSGKYDQFFDKLTEVDDIEDGTDAGISLNYITLGMTEAGIPLDKPGKLVEYDSDSPTEDVIARFAIKVGPKTTYFLIYDGGDTFPEEKGTYDTWGGFESDESMHMTPKVKKWFDVVVRDFKNYPDKKETGYEIEEILDILSLDEEDVESAAFAGLIDALSDAGYEMM